MSINKHLLAGLLCLVAGPAFGCAYHGAIDAQLKVMYPGSLAVAVALRQAADAAVIDADALVAPQRRRALYIDSVGRLQAFRTAMTAAGGLPPAFSLGFVESGLWTRYHHTDRQLRADIHTAGPDDGEPVVLTGEPVLEEILAGTLSAERALDDRLVLIQGSDEERAALRRALAAIAPGHLSAPQGPIHHAR